MLLKKPTTQQLVEIRIWFKHFPGRLSQIAIRRYWQNNNFLKKCFPFENNLAFSFSFDHSLLYMYHIYSLTRNRSISVRHNFLTSHKFLTSLRHGNVKLRITTALEAPSRYKYFSYLAMLCSLVGSVSSTQKESIGRVINTKCFV